MGQLHQERRNLYDSVLQEQESRFNNARWHYVRQVLAILAGILILSNLCGCSSGNHKGFSRGASSYFQENSDGTSNDAGESKIKIGTDDYSKLSLDQLYDKNWLQAAPDSTQSERQYTLDHYGFDSSNIKEMADIGSDVIYNTEGKNLGPIFRSHVVNNVEDSNRVSAYHHDKLAKSVPYPTEFAKKYKDTTKFAKDVNRANPAQRAYAEHLSAVFDGKPHVLNRKYIYRDYALTRASDSEIEQLIASKGDHDKSLESVSRWMLYDQSFYDVFRSPYGIWGKCRLGKDGLTEVTEIVLPSLDDPNKFDVFIDDVSDTSRYSPYISGKAQCGGDGTSHFCLPDGPDMALYAAALRKDNTKTVPFKVVLHNVERPLRAKDNEIVRVAKKFGLTEDYLKNLSGERYHQYMLALKDKLEKPNNYLMMAGSINRCEELDNMQSTKCEENTYVSVEANYKNLTQEEWFYLTRILPAFMQLNAVDRDKNDMILRTIDMKNGLKDYANFVELDRNNFGN